MTELSDETNKIFLQFYTEEGSGSEEAQDTIENTVEVYERQPRVMDD